MSEGTHNTPDSSVTVVISRRVKAGCTAEFETFLTGVIAACSQFPGYLGSNIFRPVSGDDPEYRVIFKFDQLSHLRHWEASEERQYWFAQAERLTEALPQIQVLTGLETWFTLPGKPAITPPPRYKMALVTWLTVFPLITTISIGLQDWLVPMPLVLRVMVVTAIAVPTMTYLLMPRVTQIFANWLYPPPREPFVEEDGIIPLTLESSAVEPLAIPLAAPLELEVEMVNDG